MQDVRNGGPNVLALLEHEPVVTLGRRAHYKHLRVTPEELRLRGATLQETDRGGDVTFHGPGQIVGYPIIDLRRAGITVTGYVYGLEETMMRAAARFGLQTSRVKGRRGVWCQSGKLGAVGIRVRNGIASHGFALNVSVDLAWFDCIVPCGLADTSVTSLQRELGWAPDVREVGDAIASEFATIFGMAKPR